MLKKCSSLVTSDAILNSLISNCDIQEMLVDKDVVVDCYQNGREQGYQLVLFKTNSFTLTSITFSENRNSDKIVVYVGEREKKGISEDAYNKRRFFETQDEAIGYIIEMLREMCKR